MGTFAAANPTQSNRADGAGYGFVGDVVLRLDASNFQVAAPLLAAFKNCRVLEPIRRRKAEAELRRVSRQENLPRDVADIVHGSLAPG